MCDTCDTNLVFIDIIWCLDSECLIKYSIYYIIIYYIQYCTPQANHMKPEFQILNSNFCENNMTLRPNRDCLDHVFVVATLIPQMWFFFQWDVKRLTDDSNTIFCTLKFQCIENFASTLIANPLPCNVLILSLLLLITDWSTDCSFFSLLPRCYLGVEL